MSGPNASVTASSAGKMPPGTLDEIEKYGPIDELTLSKYGGSRKHGTGDLPLYFSTGMNMANDATIDAFAKHGTTGNALNLDINSGDPIGTGVAPVMAKAGKYRATAATVYLTNPPDNLDIKTHIQIARVLLDGTKAKCIGVETVSGEKCSHYLYPFRLTQR